MQGFYSPGPRGMPRGGSLERVHTPPALGTTNEGGAGNSLLVGSGVGAPGQVNTTPSLGGAAEGRRGARPRGRPPRPRLRIRSGGRSPLWAPIFPTPPPLGHWGHSGSSRGVSPATDETPQAALTGLAKGAARRRSRHSRVCGKALRALSLPLYGLPPQPTPK